MILIKMILLTFLELNSNILTTESDFLNQNIIEVFKAYPYVKNDDSKSIDSFKKIDSITNVRQIGKLIKDSETIQKMTLYFDVVSDNTIKADSILAIISNKSIFMDDVMVLTTKVYFQKIR